MITILISKSKSISMSLSWYVRDLTKLNAKIPKQKYLLNKYQENIIDRYQNLKTLVSTNFFIMIRDLAKLNAKIPRQFQLQRRITFHEYRSQWAQSCDSFLSSNVIIQLIIIIILQRQCKIISNLAKFCILLGVLFGILEH